MEKLMEKWGGAEILRRAVRGMLPKNRLRDVRLNRLRGEWLLYWNTYNTILIPAAFEGPEHPYEKNLLSYPRQDVKSLVKELPDRSKQEWLGEVKI